MPPFPHSKLGVCAVICPAGCKPQTQRPANKKAISHFIFYFLLLMGKQPSHDVLVISKQAASAMLIGHSPVGKIFMFLDVQHQQFSNFSLA